MATTHETANNVTYIVKVLSNQGKRIDTYVVEAKSRQDAMQAMRESMYIEDTIPVGDIVAAFRSHWCGYRMNVLPVNRSE